MGKRTQQKRRSQTSNLWIVGTIAVMAVALVAMLQWVGKPSGATMVDPRKAEGSETATVTLVEFGDYL